jgi:hypothetical protein
MPLQRIALAAALVGGLAAAPLSVAQAQYYYPPCSPFPLTWPFCIVGAAVGTAATIVTAPVRVLTPAPPPPPAYYPYYTRPYYYAAPPPAYNAPGAYAPQQQPGSYYGPR